MKHSGNKTRRRQTAHRHRRRGPDPLVWVGGVAVLIIALVVVGAWQRGAFAKKPEPTMDGDISTLLPLAETGQVLWGGHDMAQIPRETPAPQEAPVGEAAPSIYVAGTSHDFGTVYEAWDVTHIFTVQNTGDADLVLSNLVTSCGCTAAELSSSVVPPGRRADLKVTFDADFHPTRGDVVRLVWFATNDVTHPWVELQVTASVK